MTEAKGYPGFLKKGFTPFDPLWLARLTEEKVCRGLSRKYTDFYCTGVYGGISTGYAVGCCLRCVFCWVDFSRDFPDRFGQFYSPDEVADRLIANARRKRLSRLRISGGEPTLCKGHLLEVLGRIEGRGFLFILETNGILLGSDEGFARELAGYRDIHVRVSLKAGTAEGLEERTGAKGKFWELPCLMSAGERRNLLRRLRETGYQGYLEEEVCDPYRASLVRLRAAGYEIF